MHSKNWFAVALCAAALLPFGNASQAGEATIDLPLPGHTVNAAVHYQRGLLFLYAVDPAKRELLNKPIWEILKGLSDPEELKKIDELLIESRHAIRATLVGTRQAHADFGIEPRHYVEATFLPHADGMVDLSKLLLLHGAQLESQGNWKDAAKIFVQVLRMGRHLAHQTTLVEAIEGTKILEGGYYVLGLWGVRCPEPALVEQVSLLLNVLSDEMIHPARTMILEFRYTKLKLTRLAEEFPDGNWAGIILEATDTAVPHTDQKERQKAAIEAAVKNGVPESVFQSKKAFAAHVEMLRSQHLAMAKEVASAMTLPTVAAIRRGQQIHEQFAGKLAELGDSAGVHPGQIAAHFAVHDAELTVVKVVMALAASRDDEGFPAQLDDVAKRFGGKVPRSPYDGSALVYKAHEDRSGFDLTVDEVNVGDIKLPKIEFRFAPGDSAN